MSIAPDDAWRDAGLQDVEDTASLVEEVDDPVRDVEDPEEYRPGTPRPDLDGVASEADVVEQSQVVPQRDDEPGAADEA